MVARGASDDRRVVAGEAERAQRSDIGPLVRRQDGLRVAAVGQRLHFGESLQRSESRVGDRAAVALRREVAGREPA